MQSSPSRLTVLLALLFVLVLVADVTDMWLERRRGERNVLIDATVRFEPRDRVVRLPRLADDGSEPGVILGPGWTVPEGGGLGVPPAGASLRLRVPMGAVRTVIVEARKRPGPDAAERLRVEVDGIELGTIDLDRSWRQESLGVAPSDVERRVLELRFEGVDGGEAVIRTVAVAAATGARLEDLDRAGGMDRDPRHGSVSVSRPGRLIVDVAGGPVAARLVARTRFLSSDGRLPEGRARLAVSAAPSGGGPVARLATAGVDAADALWQDVPLEVPATVPVRLAVTVEEIGDGDTFMLESVWRRPN